MVLQITEHIFQYLSVEVDKLPGSLSKKLAVHPLFGVYFFNQIFEPVRAKDNAKQAHCTGNWNRPHVYDHQYEQNQGAFYSGDDRVIVHFVKIRGWKVNSHFTMALLKKGLLLTVCGADFKYTYVRHFADSEVLLQSF